MTDFADPGQTDNVVTLHPGAWTKEGFQVTGESMTMAWLDEMTNNGGVNYCCVNGYWFVYADGVWTLDETGIVARAVGAFCRRVGLVKKNKAKTRREIETFAMHRGILMRARDELSVGIGSFDADDELLVTPGGMLALDGDDTPMMPHDRDRYASKCCAVAPSDMATPLWDQFIDRICGGKSDLVEYLYRFFGYCLTGLTTEQIFVFCYGLGQNGKTVLLETIRGIMGSYASKASIELLIEHRHERHPEELASMRGVRLLMAEETNSGRSWNEALLKQLVSGDTLRARFMRRDSFEFQPKFKIVVAGNHKPRISAVDKAMKRRIHIIPFNVQIQDHEKNPRLRADLREEWPGILAKLIDGQRQWRLIGLAPPAAVIDATAEYVEDEDAVGQWLDDCGIKANTPRARASMDQLYRSWVVWAGNNGEAKISKKALSQALCSHGFERYRVENERGFIGLHITPSAPGSLL